jgi:hypothetical protein
LALKTVREQLLEVQTAITAVMSGQAYEINGRSLTRANLSWLHEREKWLLSRADAGQLDTIPGEKRTKGAFGVSFGA